MLCKRTLVEPFTLPFSDFRLLAHSSRGRVCVEGTCSPSTSRIHVLVALKQCSVDSPFQEDSIFQRFVVGPRSKQQMLWSTVGAVWIVWDLCPAWTCARFASLVRQRKVGHGQFGLVVCCHLVGGS